MKGKNLVDELYALSAFARYGYPSSGLADSIMDAAAEAKKMTREIAAYKMTVKSLEAKLAFYRKDGRHGN